MKTTFCFVLTVHAAHLVLSLVLREGYTVPKPRIKLLLPQGFRVSIPHEDGIELFAFHGNVNKPMVGLEAGHFSKDVLSRRKNRWIFEDRSTKLKQGDVIYFWLFVIKDKLGYRYDDGEYQVKDISSIPTEPVHNSVSSQSTINIHEGIEGVPPKVDTSTKCEAVFSVADKIQNLEAEVERLREYSGILRELVEKSEDASMAEMKFEGVLPPYDSAAYSAQVIIDEKLGLSSVPILNATWNSDKSIINFRLANVDDRIDLIRTAKKELVNSKIKLVY